MASFANIIAANFKRGDMIMFAMGSRSHGRVASRADRSLGGQFACAPMYYGVFLTIVDLTITNGCLGCVCGVCFGNEKGFNIGLNSKLP